MSRPESDFPTIADALAVLRDLDADGFGALPVQIIMAPPSTLMALARHYGRKDIDAPAAMIEMTPDENGGRVPVCIISSDGLASTKPLAVQ